MDALDRAAFLRQAGAVALLQRGSRTTRADASLPSPLDELQREIDGTVVARTSPGYDAGAPSSTTRASTRTARSPSPTARASATSSKTIAWSRTHGIRIAPRGGGHSYGGYSSVPGGVIVDVSRLAAVSVHPGRQATVGAGAKLIDVYAGLAAHGVTVPAGSCATVGIGGQVLGGGVGFLSRKLGTTSDNLFGLTLVTADGQARTCSATENADLYWASRGGGGGNFGIATEYRFRTTAISTVSTFTASWHWAQAKAVIAAWQKWAPHAPDELFSVCNLGSGGGSPTVRVSGQLIGSPARLQTLLGPLVSAVPPATLSVKPRPYLTAVQYWAGCGPVSECHLEPFGKLTRATVRGQVRLRPQSAAARRPPRRSCRRSSGRREAARFSSTRTAARSTACRRRRRRSSTATCSARCSTSRTGTLLRRRPPNLAWLRAFSAAMRPYVSGQSYVNYIDPDLAGRPQAYYGSNLARLVSIKRRYDPGNVFRFKQSIPLARLNFGTESAQTSVPPCAGMRIPLYGR